MHGLVAIFSLDGRKSIESPPTRIGRMSQTFLFIVLIQSIRSLPSMNDLCLDYSYMNYGYMVI